MSQQNGISDAALGGAIKMPTSGISEQFTNKQTKGRAILESLHQAANRLTSIRDNLMCSMSPVMRSEPARPTEDKNVFEELPSYFSEMRDAIVDMNDKMSDIEDFISRIEL